MWTFPSSGVPSALSTALSKPPVAATARVTLVRQALRVLARWQRYPSRTSWQRLQPYLVNLYVKDTRRPGVAAHLAEVTEGLYRWTGDYDLQRGIATVLYDPSDLDVVP